MAASGDIGYTVGTNQFTVPDAAGKSTVMARPILREERTFVEIVKGTLMV